MDEFPLVYPWIRQCLQDSAPASGANAIANSYFDLTIDSVLGDFFPAAVLATAGFPDDPVGFYNSLSGRDAKRVAEAAGLATSARLLAGLSTGGANGDLASEKTETVSRTFTAGPGERDRWLSRSALLIRQCTFTPNTGISGASMFAASGPSRSRLAAGRGYEDGGDCW